MTDIALIGLAQYRLEQADRDSAASEDVRQLLDLIPAVLDRLREYAIGFQMIAREFAAIDRITLSDQNTFSGSEIGQAQDNVDLS